ncbi:MAG: endopeptidase [Thermoleophilales bacterium]|nr:endopeptidase [Thermoleophilales bacterium]
MLFHRFGLPLAVGLAVAAAGVATLALRPREGQIEPAEVEPRAYFSDQQLDRARDFRGPQRVLALTNLALTGVALALVALRPPQRLREALARGRPWRTAAATGAGLSVALALVTLPIAAVMHQRSRDYGLATQGWAGWMADLAKSSGIGALFAALGAMLLLWLLRRFPRRWWVAGSVAVVALAVIFSYVSPVVLDPIFNKFQRLPAGQLRSDVLDLARRSNVDVGEVYKVDASRRTTAVNAYVNGIGHTKRVVLYDNLIDRFPRDQINSVVAHELGHVRHRDVPRGLLWVAIAAPASVLATQRLAELWAAPGASLGEGRGSATPLAIPAVLLALGLVSFLTQIPGNAMSRAIERRADAYALDLTQDPAALIGLQRRLAVDNVAEPDPPGWVQALFGTHPTTVERIGGALTWSRRH